MGGPIRERLASGEVLIADGATGTMLLAAGLPAGLPGEAWVLERPEEIKKLHRAYVAAGSQLILTCTFGGSRSRLGKSGLEAQVGEINRRAAELAREVAAEERAAVRRVYVGGDIGPSGEMMAPIGKLAYAAAVEIFAEQVTALAAGGVDCIYIETMGDLNEARAAVEGAKQACDLPVFCSFSFDTRGRTAFGISPAQAARAMAEMGVSAVGANCGHAPEDVLGFLPELRAAAPGLPLIAKPNAGLPRLAGRESRTIVYDAGPERMAELARQYAALGASIIGTCCGSSPEHIAAIAAALRLAMTAPDL